MNTAAPSKTDVLLIGYENQENLGLRSIIAYLQAKEHTAMLVPYVPGKDDLVLKEIRAHNPQLVGFSLIFQFSIETFSTLMRYLRQNGVHAHFTAGGHFPSLRPTETLELIPDLDSIVRFEGEETLLELLQCLEKPECWNRVKGIAYRGICSSIETEHRPLIKNLDELPFVHRNEPTQTVGGIRIASMLASRGCLFNCSFCSIRQFYGTVPGKLRRSRSPENVVEEMHALFRQRDVRFFSFQDDDFASNSPVQKTWIRAFLKALRDKKLDSSIKWKISCRVDDIEPDLLQEMARHGLFAIYLGVESGNQAGLNTLNKQVSVQKNLDAIAIVKSFNLALSIGFMLFDPSSTASSIAENIRFLSTIGHDGYFPVNFGKMLPYAGTPIEQQLRDSGRLTGTVTHPDYEFSSLDLNWYAFLVQKLFARRNFSPEGIASLQSTDFEYRLIEALDRERAANLLQQEKLRKLISQSNTLAIETLNDLLEAIETMGADAFLREEKRLLSIADKEWTGEAQVRHENMLLLNKLHAAVTT
jgi:anaerobic magnesium-protoporphyrin IX monomethyl ester cyclase